MRNHFDFRLLLTGVLAVLAASACSASEPGAAQPATTGNSATIETSSSAPTSESSVAPGSPTAQLDPCSLLSPGELAEFNTFEFQPGHVPDYSGGSRPCSWNTPREAGNDGMAVLVAIRDSQSVDEVDLVDSPGATPVQTGTLNERRVAQAAAPGICLIALAVGDGARVDIGINGPGVPDDACPETTKIAEIVEPKLPEG
ncbi:DUF3558 family protein [Saccharomonospora sp. NPDC046836]|uniref:DUF3558 family protein n=1 Tax=Saccharomonospora sp. NPDC046836 TaxID=3156921 RepID=UPI0033CEBFB4